MKRRLQLLAAGAMLFAASAQANESAAYQFEQNAKLVGRAQACDNRAGASALRSVSSELAGLLAGTRTHQQNMAYFDAKVERQRRFAEGTDPEGSACRRNSEDLRDSLDRTTHIIRLSE